MKKRLILPLLFFVLPADAIVNLEEIHTRDVEFGTSATLGLNISGSKGNSDKSDVQLSALLQRASADATDILIASYEYGEANSQLNSDRAFIHLRHVQKLDSNYAWELFSQLQRDSFSRLSLRSLAGGGLRYKLTDANNRSIFGMGAFYEEERISRDALQNSESSRLTNWRGNFYSIIGHKINKQSALYGTLYFQPQFNNIEDHRLLLQSGIKVKIAGNLTLNVGLDAKYDSKPPLDVNKYDINYRSGLEYRF